ncbi:MAG TPA: endonuclease/exonuclease/phosphatase family protein [Vicinamibacterales bacterium]|nr:endonuclease/exonuclease/phosphatase family protein [Vicinamibacterales bacterium]
MIRVATYNVHRCRGMDRRVSVARITEVIERLDADVVAVQEIFRGHPGDDEQADQVTYIARALGYHFAFGENRLLWGKPYGNATFSRLPIVRRENYDITWHAHERRGCLRADLRTAGGGVLHLYNVHLSTRYFSRPHQARRLLSVDVLGHPTLTGPRIVVGDFNEWTRGVATRLMGSSFESVDVRLLGRRRTYPGLFPVLHLDHFYYDRSLALRSFRLERSRLALVASDHLPLVAEFGLPAQ